MAKEEKKSVLLYATHWRVLRKLSMEQRDHIFHAIFALIGEEEMPELDFVEDLVFTTIQENILDNIAKWEESKRRKSEGGKRARANAAKKNEHTSSMFKIDEDTSREMNILQHNVNDNVNANANVNVNDNVNVNVNVNDNVPSHEDDEVFHSHEVIHSEEQVIHSGKVLSESEVIEMVRQKSDEQLAAARFNDMAAMYPNMEGAESVTTEAKLPLLDVRLVDMGKAINKHAAECDVCMPCGEWFAGGYRSYL